jgi:dTDP-4-dehydrorhamnose reductase
MNKIAILGGKGMLGTDLAELAKSAGHEVSVFDLPEFNITLEADARNAVSHADVLVNCAAYTAVDKAEIERETCRSVNALAVAALAKFAKGENKYLVHISTDFVFGDESQNALSEDDIPKPLSWYGATKLEGEKLLQASGCRHAIVRLEWTYGRNGVNFISKMLEAAMKNPKLKVVGDQTGSPTWTADAARAIMCLIKKQTEGLYHFSADGYASRYEVAKFIMREKRIEKEISSCSSSDFPTPAKRPGNSRFNCSKIDKVIDFKRPCWQESMSLFLKEI